VRDARPLRAAGRAREESSAAFNNYKGAAAGTFDWTLVQEIALGVGLGMFLGGLGFFVMLRMILLELLAHPTTRAIANAARAFSKDDDKGEWWEKLIKQGARHLFGGFLSGAQQGQGPMQFYQPPPGPGKPPGT
jgi:hypothetical protein